MSGAVDQPLPLARRVKATHRPLLSSCALAAAMVAIGYAGPAHAQAFQAGTPTFRSGDIVSRNITSSTTETIVINTPTAVINWTPTDTATGGGAIDYLPSGNVATFEGGINVSDYTVLNRIIPADQSRAIAFNGSVLSTVGVSSPTRGGNIWFYSPGGILAGATSTFDVGSLVLTANDIDITGDLFGPSGEIRFRGATDSRSAVTIAAGARITASNNDSYVALVAPRVSQGGSVSVNGSVAYVAAESADITINGGLFDIAVQTGSAVNAGGETTLTHSGSTTGPGPNDFESQAVYMVAVPKNDAVTMLVSGTVGYGAATGAALENGAVILSAGYGLFSSAPDAGIVSATTATPPTTQNASINISGGSFTSRVLGYAVTDATGTGGGGTLDFDSALDLRAGRNASLTANAGEAITIDGSVGMSTNNLNSAGAAAAGQAIFRAVDGGTITVLGGATAFASSNGGPIAGTALFEATNGSTLDFRRESFVFANGTNGTSGGSAQGGTASINLSNSTFKVGEQVQVTANATGAGGPNGGNGTGGTASVTAVNSTLEIAGPLLVTATGAGGRGAIGGNGRGGTATVSLDDSPLSGGTFGNLSSLQIDAIGTGSDGTDGGTGGNGTGGTASLTIFDSTPDPSPAALGISNIIINAYGTGGSIEFGYGSNGGAGGIATGGSADFTFSAGTLTTSGIEIDVFADGGDGGQAASGPDGGNGGAATGGTGIFTVNGGTLNGDFTNIGVDAGARGGRGGNAFEFGYGASGDGGIGGAATAGTASFVQNGGSITGSFFDISANGSGGDGGSSTSAAGGAGGNGTGGAASATLSAGTLTLTSGLFLNADGFGARGGSTSTLPVGGLGGIGQGGIAKLLAEGGTGDLSGLSIDASGSGDSGGFGIESPGGGGASRGGTADFEISSGSLTLGSLSVMALGEGPTSSTPVASGEARGGTASAKITGGSLSVTSAGAFSTIEVDASGTFDGGEGGSPGNAFGGDASFLIQNGGSLTYAGTDDIRIEANGEAALTFAGTGGNATGGTATFVVDNATLDLGAAPLLLSAAGSGGSISSSTPGVGGNGTGGTASLLATNGGSFSSDGFVVIDASGSGGDAFDFSFSDAGGDAGTGTGGTAKIEALDGSISLTNNVLLIADGDGGAGLNGDGGAGIGGSASILSNGPDGQIDLSGLSTISVSGSGSSTFENGYGLPPSTGNGGAGIGGDILLGTGGGTLTLGDIVLFAQGIGGDGSSGSFGSTPSNGGNGGAATGGSVTLIGGDSSFDLTGSVTAIDVSATGGEGGFGSFSSTGPGGNGGNGGAATGGTLILAAAGQNGALDIAADLLPSLLDNFASGGAGGDGGSGTVGGRGGNGGNATGGTVEIRTDLGTVTVNGLSGGPQFEVTAVAGDGGFGGDGSNVGDTGGDGGNGGDGLGGTIKVNVNGGAVNLGSPSFFAHGNGGFAGNGGTGAGTPFIPGDPFAIPPIPDTPAGPTTPASQGLDGRGRGGAISIIVADNSDTGEAGSATFGDSFFNVAGFANDGFEDVGGRIEIYDNGNAAGGGIEMASLTGISQGFSETSDQALDIFSAARRINILGDANFDLGGPAYFRASGSGGLDVGGTLDLTSSSFVNVEHDSQPATPSDTVTASDVFATAASDFSASADSRIRSLGAIDVSSTSGNILLNHADAGASITLTAPGTVTGGDLAAGGGIGIDAGSDVTFTSALAGSNIDIFSGGAVDIGDATSFIETGYGSIGGSISVDAAGDVTLGTAIAADDVTIQAGGSADIGSASALGETGYGLFGDILVDASSIIIDAADATGDIDLTTAGGNAFLVDPVIGNIITAGTLLAGQDINVDGLDIVSVTSAEAGRDLSIVSATLLSAGTAKAGRDVLIDGSHGITAGTVTGGRDVEIATSLRGSDTSTAPARSIEIGSAEAGDDLVVAAFGSVTADALGTTGAGEDGTQGTRQQYEDEPGSSIYLVSEKGAQIGSITAADNFRAINVPEFRNGFQISDGSGGITINSVVAGGNIDLESPNSAVAVLNNIAAGGSITATSTGITLAALGDVSIDLADATDGNFIVRSSGGSISLGTILARDSIGAEASAGNIDATDLQAVNGISLKALGDVAVVDAIATGGGSTMLIAAGARPSGGYDLGGDATISGIVSAGSSVGIDGGGDVTILSTGQVRSDGDILIRSGDDIFIGGSVGLGSAPAQSSGISSGLTGVRAGGPADTVSVDAGALRFGSPNTQANGASTLSVDGTVVGLEIGLRSEDIAAGSGALIGDTQTASLSLANSGTGRTFIGGAGSSGGYSLSNAEFGRLQAARISLFGPQVASSAGLADLTIQALDLFGSQQGTPPSGRRANLVGSDAGVEISSTGSIRIEGNVALTSAAQTDTLTISGNQRIDMIVPDASIVVTDSQGALSGGLRLAAETVQVATSQAAQDLTSLTDTTAIDRRLGQNEGAVKPEGYLQADAIEFAVDNALFIQNSGDADPATRAGFTAGSGGVSIDTGESSSAKIVINGRQSQGGSFTGGGELIPLLLINGQHNPSDGFDLRSTANSCLIVSSSCMFDIPEAPPVQDVIDDIIDAPDDQENQDGTAVVQALNLPLIQLVDYDGLSFEPLIDEPVTGTGNDDFWLGDGKKDEDGN